MMNELLAGLGYFVYVFFKAVQQKNVAFDHFRWIMPVSYCMAITEVLVISIIAITAVKADSILSMFAMVVAIGTGGGLGALTAMYVHIRWIK